MIRKSTGISLFAVALLLVAATLLLFLWPPSLAYFQAIFDKDGINTVMVELIFDQLDFESENIDSDLYYEEKDGVEEPWGSEHNPYVISQKHHVQNLAVLQNTGFFSGRVQRDENGEPILDGEGNPIPEPSYFLVCTREGTPVAIDCEGMTIAPVGTHENPFTGVIGGAPVAGEATYAGYGVSVSTIANLRVEAALDEPDIGFFGTLGYCGSYDEATTSVTGFAARVEDLLLADVTVASDYTLFDSVAAWWEGLTGHTSRAEDYAETHHVGIIAGHAEFATVNRVSVYYSEDVEAFDLVSAAAGCSVNYYSSTGLIGLLEHVNPILGEGGVLDGGAGITDKDVIGDGSGGGGGEGSGTLTGYFLAGDLFARHEATLAPEDLRDEYNVVEMRETEGDATVPLFKTVTMPERDQPLTSWKYRNYFYFQDTVFTFAMSMSLASDQNGNTTETIDPKKSDYVKKIWKTGEDREIDAVGPIEDLECRYDSEALPRVAYRLDTVTDLTEGETYVLAYLEKNGEGTADDVLHVLNLHDTAVGGTRVKTVKIGALSAAGGEPDRGEMYGDAVYFGDDDGGGIESVELIGTALDLYNYSFRYDKANSLTIRNPFDETFKLGVMATSGGSNTHYGNLTTVVNAAPAASGNVSGDEVAYFYNWTVTAHADDPRRFSVSASYTLGENWVLWNTRSYCGSKLAFVNEGGTPAFSFQSIATESESERNTWMQTKNFAEENYFTVLEVTANVLDESGTIIDVLGGKNHELTPRNILPKTEEDVLYSFDPSRYVLEYLGPSDHCAGEYRLAPLRYYKLNNGKSGLLSEINHAAVLYKTHNASYQMHIGDAIGILETTIGTANPDKLYSIPTGMIAFEINKASVEEPSFINLIVAITPEQEITSTVGIWAMQKSTWETSFDINSPTYTFDLPVSKTGNSDADLSLALHVVEHYKEIPDGERYSTVLVADENGVKETSHLYLGGQKVLVYREIAVTSPGVYMLGSTAGPLSVAYFSVTGAAGEGEDGASGSPLGDIDFVYAYDGKIVTTDKKYAGDAPLLENESYDVYYPSYLFVSMLPSTTPIQHEVIRLRRYIAPQEEDPVGTRRHLVITYAGGGKATTVRGVSEILQDMQDDVESVEKQE